MEDHHQILHIQINLGSKFQLQQTILIILEQICPENESIQSKATKNEQQH